MSTWRRWWQRTKGVLGGGPADAELAAELELHLELQTEDNIRAGMAPAQARREALLKLGGVERVKESYRDQRGWPVLEEVLKDLRFAWRGLLRRPGFALVAVLSIGFGIGVNTTIFSWLKAVYLNPLPGVKNAPELVTINAAFQERGGAGYSNSFPDFREIEQQSRSFAGLFAHEMLSATLSDGRRADKLMGSYVTANYFGVLGVQPALGRTFRPEENNPAAANVIVISHHLWEQRFARDPQLVGRKLLLNRQPVTVVGIAAAGFRGVYGGIAQDYWVPLALVRQLGTRQGDPLAGPSWLQIMGRPRPGAGVAAIQAELDILSARFRDGHRKATPDYRAVVNPLHQAERGYHSGLFQIVRVLGIAAVVVLLLACVNVAGMLLARANERSHELTIRFSLGASRGRVIRQLLVESLLLAALGGLVGLGFALLSQPLPRVLSATGVEMIFNSAFDGQVLLFLLAATVLSALLFGVAPAYETSGFGMAQSLRVGAANLTADKRKRGFRSALVVVQVAICTAALGATAIVAGSLRQAISADPGFRADGVLTAEVDTQAAGFDEVRGQAFYRAVAERLRSAPEIAGAAWTSFLPMSGSGGGNNRPVEIKGYATPDGRPLSITVDTVSEGYLQTMGISLVQGREFNAADTGSSQPVAVVNEKFAERFLAGRDPVGVFIRVGNTWRTIAGVHRNYIYRSPSQPVSPAILLPLTQDYKAEALAVIRTRHQPADAAPLLRNAVAQQSSEVPVTRVITMEQNVSAQYLDFQIMTAILSAFSLLACVLAAIGLYGTLALFVNQHRRELGVRAALGATTAEVCGFVLRQSARLTVIGAACGLALAFGAGRLLQAGLYGMVPDRLFHYVIAALGVAVTACVASVPPFVTVARLNPVEALRHE